MLASKYLLAFLMVIENFSAVVYADSAGHKTIGYGHKLLPGEYYNQPITEEEAAELLRKDLQFAEKAVQENVCVNLSQGQYDALVSLVYNIGAGRFAESGLLNKLNDGDFHEALRRLRQYNKVRSPISGELVVSTGLDWRRKMEEVFWRVPD